MPRSSWRVTRFFLQLMAASAFVLARSNFAGAQGAPEPDPAPATFKLEPERGNLALEIALGALGASLGTFAAYSVQFGPRPSECGESDVPDPCVLVRPFSKALLFGALVPALTISGVMLAGSVSDAEGRLGLTVAGGYLVGLAAFGVSFAETNSLDDRRVIMPITAGGVLLGSVLGYRLFARHRVPGSRSARPRWLAVPSVGPHSASLMLGGEL